MIGKIQRPFLAKFLPDSLLGVYCRVERRTLTDGSGVITTQMGSAMDQKMVAVEWNAL
jgi:hypothetical protein